jgi:hypothetical protein
VRYYLEILEKLDPDLLKRVEHTGKLLLADGALSKKFKLLIMMALDASLSALQRVKSLAQAATLAGAYERKDHRIAESYPTHQRGRKRLQSRTGFQGTEQLFYEALEVLGMIVKDLVVRLMSSIDLRLAVFSGPFLLLRVFPEHTRSKPPYTLESRGESR